MAKKIDSLWKLRVLGLNTPNFKILKSILDVDYFFNRTDWRRISIRTDVKNSARGISQFGLPFFPNLDYLEARKLLLGDTIPIYNLDIIVSEGINPDDALLSGKIMIRNELRGDLEYTLGASTVRSLDQIIPERYTVELSDYRNIPLLKFPIPLEKLIYQIRQIILPSFLTPFIIEFSIYSHPIGRLKDRLIYWEVTPTPR